MFNHHFFDGEVRVKHFYCFYFTFHDNKALSLQASSTALQSFLTESEGQKVVMVADPPFGGLVKPLAQSFSLVSHTWKKLQSSG